jgi:poly-gamma-glutamate synthesis protein (capsule biosynthesis protein)
MFRINFMGDVMFGELLENFRRGLGTMLEKGSVDPFEYVAPLLKRTELNVINLECIFSDWSSRRKPFSDILISPNKYIIHLVENNINVVNTANNHALDHGREAFEESLELLAHHGIKVIGYQRNSFFQEEPVVMMLDGKRIGFLGYNISNFPDEDRRKHVTRIVDVISGIRPSLDSLVVSMHWGEEYTNIPPSYVVEFGKGMLEAGCDVIHGHHSHQIQGVIKVGDRIFAPSLGNFIFDQTLEANRITAVLQVEIHDEGEPTFSYMPYYMNDLYQPVPSPLYEGYIDKVNGYLAECLEEEGAARYEETVRNNVNAGHRGNRIDMRTRMLGHFWDYLPYAWNILMFRFKKEKIFSVIEGEGYPDTE